MTCPVFKGLSACCALAIIIGIGTGCGSSPEGSSSGTPAAAEDPRAAPGTLGDARSSRLDALTERPGGAAPDSVRLFWVSYREATRLRQAMEYAAAEVNYLAALEQNPTHHDALYYLGNVRLELGRFEEARNVYTRLISVDPGSIRGHAQLATLAFCRPETPTFDLSAAARSFERANALNPGETGPVLRLAEVALFNGDAERARRLVTDVLGQDEHNLEALYLRAYLSWMRDHSGSWRDEVNAVLAQMELKPVGPIAGEGDTDATGGGGPAYAAGAACPLIDNFVREMRRAGSPADAAVASAELKAFDERIHSLPR